ncbi:MAG: AAA family ATPase [Proteobacteria bacterium]|nr:AAA family ATPase [Pseudomonadota bacterium]
MTGVENGAQFYTADLHVHSAGGSVDADKGMTVEAILDEAVKLGISILAITDHNSDRNTEASIQYGQKYAGQLLVLAGTEITTAHGHLLVYFAPDQRAQLRTFLGQISIQHPDTPDSHTTMSMTDVIERAHRLGGVCIAAHIDLAKTGFEMQVAGYPNWKKDIITSAGLYGLEFADAANLAWYSDADDGSPAGVARKGLLTARRATRGPLSTLARVQNSDAHTLSAFRSAPGKKLLTRVKLSELSFDAFKLALVDADARARATVELPAAIPRIIGMAVSGGFIDNAIVHFSPNLNCFIGGRGAGKSTALRSLGYGLNVHHELKKHDNCPDSVVIYCEAANKTLYRYERSRGGELKVLAREGSAAVTAVPPDSFRVEFYDQGHLSKVADDPLSKPQLLQEFLDRHLIISDLTARETELLSNLKNNGAQLIPLETKAATLGNKKQQLTDIDTKLKVAEDGKLQDLVKAQAKLNAEHTLRQSIDEIRKFYDGGISLKNFLRDYARLVSNAGELTGDARSSSVFEQARAAVEAMNAYFTTSEATISKEMKDTAAQLASTVNAFNQAHATMGQELEDKLAELRAKGLSGDIAEVQTLLTARQKLVAEINRIEAEQAQLTDLRTQRSTMLTELAGARDSLLKRRKEQLSPLIRSLQSTITDYTVALVYEDLGPSAAYQGVIKQAMASSYFADDHVLKLAKIPPSDLAALVKAGNEAEILSRTSLDAKWGSQVVERFRDLTHLHALETTWSPPQPGIIVRTKGLQPRRIPVNQLSDGQKHTILLTIAMLAESNLPLIIDQPEDDLDNRFIFDSVVKTLRAVKERRQVILVTHNANIAVLGDAELILPMRRDGDAGAVFDRGSIDRTETKRAAQSILEGGDQAFQRRREIYGGP